MNCTIIVLHITNNLTEVWRLLSATAELVFADVWLQLRHASACFRQELCDTEPLVNELHDMLEQQRSVLSLCQNMSG